MAGAPDRCWHARRVEREERGGVRRGSERRDNMLRDAIDDVERTRVEGRGEGEAKFGEIKDKQRQPILSPLRTGHRVESPNTPIMDNRLQPVVLVTGASRYVPFVAHQNPQIYRPTSSGIGLATVKSLLEEQSACVVAISRSTNDALIQLQSRHSSRLVQVHGDM